MKLCCSILLFIFAVSSIDSLALKVKKLAPNKQSVARITKASNVRALGPKTKQPASRVSNISQKKQKSSAQNIKRWIPKSAGKKPVKYVVKIVNNTKRWMPAFADFSNEMESSMMYDSGYVAGGEQPSTFAGPQQQSLSMYRSQPQSPSTGNQNTPPEQSFLLPGQDEPYQGAGAVGRPINGQYQQGYANDIEAFTKDVSTGMPGTADNSDLSSLENYQDSAFMNPKFQEGDYIGNSLQESKQPNLFDSFTFEPTLAQNFATSPTEPGSSITKPQESPKISGSSQAATTKAGKEQQSKQPQVKATSKETSKVENVDNKKAAEQPMKNAAENVGNAAKNAKFVKQPIEDDSNTGKNAEKNEAKEKEVKEKNDANDASSDKNEKNAGKEKQDGKEMKNLKTVQATKEKNTAEKPAKVMEVQKENKQISQGGESANIDENKAAVEENANAQESEKVVDAVDTKQKGDEIKEENAKETSSEKSNENETKEQEDANSIDTNKDENKVTHSSKQAPLKANNLENDEDSISEEGQAIINKQINKMKLQKEQKSQEQDSLRIKKLKQRIHNQKQIRHQASAATRYQISDTDLPVSGTSVAANVSPAKETLRLAAGQLRKQLVTNLRHALMKNVVAAIAHRKNTAAGMTLNGGGNMKQLSQQVRPGSMQQESAALSNNQQSVKQQEGNTANQDMAVNNQASGVSNMAQQNTDTESSQQDTGKSSNDHGLTTTLMKMDKSMLVETIIKLLRKSKGDKKAKENNEGGSSDEQQNQKQDSEKSDSAGNINQSFHDQGQQTSEGDQKQETGTQHGGAQSSQDSQEGESSSPQKADVAEASTQLGVTDKEEVAANAQPSEAETAPQSEGTHSEFKAFPVKTQDGERIYKLQKLQNQDSKSEQVRSQQKADDPYSQIGLVDPANNDKTGSHHSESSPLKQDLQRQSNLVSKFISGSAKEESDNAETSSSSNSEDQKLAAATPQSDETANVDQQPDSQESTNQAALSQESSNQGSSEQQPATQSLANVKTEKETSSNNVPDQNQDNNQASDQQAVATQQAEAQQSPASYESASTQQSDQQPQQQQRQIHEESVQQLPDGTKIESQVSADSSRVLAQLNKISDKLHQKMAETSQSKMTQRILNGKVKNFASDFNNVEMPQDDAYATIGSLDPNVKKKAAIVKKKFGKRF